jgi:hypothetical protein
MARQNASVASLSWAKSYMGKAAILVMGGTSATNFSRHHWMDRIMMGREKEAPRNVQVTIVDNPIVLLENRFAMFAVPSGNEVPWQSWMIVMNNMEIIEQEERTENPRVFDDSGTSRARVGRAVLSKGSEERQRNRGIQNTEQI